MSCGQPHETDCSEVIERVYEFIDNEMPDGHDYAKIRQHLDECAPCLREYGLEEAVKSLVKRCCQDPAPEALRQKVLMRLSVVRAELAD